MSAFYALLLTATSSIWIVSQLSYGVIDLREALHASSGCTKHSDAEHNSRYSSPIGFSPNLLKRILKKVQIPLQHTELKGNVS
jgi:hypothetical protein